MRAIRILLAAALLTGVLVVAGCASEQEQVWSSFIDAVVEKRVDEAVTYIDFERMVQKAMADDPDAAAGLAFLGGSEGAASMLEGFFRESFAAGELELEDSGVALDKRKPDSVETEGDFSTLRFDVDGDDTSVLMERIDGEWKIVGFE